VSSFGLTGEEMAFLVLQLKPDDRVFEYGTGETTLVMAKRCRYVTAVEHKAEFARDMIRGLGLRQMTNVSVVYAPPDLPYAEGTADDGDLATFRTYVESYVGRGIDVVVIDGRARCEAARWVNERAPFGPHPDMRIFVHDIDRPSYEPIWKDQVVDGKDGPLIVKSIFVEERRVGRLALLRMRQP